MNEAKLNIKEETSAKKTRSPPKKTRVEQSVPKKKKLKTDADKAAEKDRKSTRLNSSHDRQSRMPSSA